MVIPSSALGVASEAGQRLTLRQPVVSLVNVGRRGLTDARIRWSYLAVITAHADREGMNTMAKSNLSLVCPRIYEGDPGVYHQCGAEFRVSFYVESTTPDIAMASCPSCHKLVPFMVVDQMAMEGELTEHLHGDGE